MNEEEKMRQDKAMENVQWWTQFNSIRRELTGPSHGDDVDYQ